MGSHRKEGGRRMQESLKVKTPEHVTLNFRLAGIGSRGAAQIVDTLILSLLYIGMVAILTFTDQHLERFFFEARSAVIAFVIILLFAIQWGYFFLFEWLSGGKTPGKMIIGIRVVKEDGGKASILSILIRNLLRIIDMLPFYYLIGMLMVFFHKNHKRLGDLVAGTIVIHERKKRKNSNKQNPVEQELQNRGIEAGQLEIGEWARKSFSKKDWDLLNTYVHRYPGLKASEKTEMSKQVASILLPKIGLEDGTTNIRQLEDWLFSAYLALKEDWDFRL
jgi:uncharacterized RDD family membrane protein YckC